MTKRRWGIEYLTSNVNGNSFFIPKASAHRPASQAIISGRPYEPKTHHIIRELFRKHHGDLVHAGAFFGDMLPSFSKSVGELGTVYAFEPVLEHHVLAKKCIEANNLKNVVLINSGLAEEAGSLSILTENGRLGGASTIKEGGDQIISTISIDTLRFKQLRCIQLDIEGYELQALKGAHRTIQEFIPAILIEDNKKECSDFLHAHNYELAGRIPGLDIWLHQASNQFRATLLRSGILKLE